MSNLLIVKRTPGHKIICRFQIIFLFPFWWPIFSQNCLIQGVALGLNLLAFLFPLHVVLTISVYCQTHPIISILAGGNECLYTSATGRAIFPQGALEAEKWTGREFKSLLPLISPFCNQDWWKTGHWSDFTPWDQV